MKQCQQCGQLAQDNERFCSVCGTALPETSNEAVNDPNAMNQIPQAAPVSYQQPDPQQAQYVQQPDFQQPQYAQPQYVQPQYSQQAPPPTGSFGSYGPQATTKSEFLKLEENKKMRNMCNAAGIICYVAAGITLLSIFLTSSWTSILDVGILVGLGLGIHLKQNRVCAIILLVYSIINTIYILIAMGTFGGWLIIVAGIYAVISTFNVDKQWKLYQQQTGGQQPPVQPPYQQQPPYQP